MLFRNKILELSPFHTPSPLFLCLPPVTCEEYVGLKTPGPDPDSRATRSPIFCLPSSPLYTHPFPSGGFSCLALGGETTGTVTHHRRFLWHNKRRAENGFRRMPSRLARPRTPRDGMHCGAYNSTRAADSDWTGLATCLWKTHARDQKKIELSSNPRQVLHKVSGKSGQGKQNRQIRRNMRIRPPLFKYDFLGRDPIDFGGSGRVISLGMPKPIAFRLSADTIAECKVTVRFLDFKFFFFYFPDTGSYL